MTTFFIGPMSRNVIDTVIERSRDTGRDLTLIPSRRQVDFDGGYVETTSAFSRYVRKETDQVLLQRDHAGPGQGRRWDRGLESLRVDCRCGFDLIHIDTWLEHPDLEASVAATASLLSDCVAGSDQVRFEVGTEEAIRRYEADELDDFLGKLKEKVGGRFDRIEFATIQAGTRLEGTKNVGVFDSQRCADMVAVCRKHGLRSKEHNGDYLTGDDLQKRVDLGVDGVNVGPQLGAIESATLLDLLSEEDVERFFGLCRAARQWVKWLPAGIDPDQNKLEVMRVAGHYVYREPAFVEMIRRYDTAAAVKRKLGEAIDRLWAS